MKSTHVLLFKGVGMWRDQDNEVYPQGKEIRIKSEVSEKEFLESRPDIKFMVGYGQLTINTATAEETDNSVAEAKAKAEAEAKAKLVADAKAKAEAEAKTKLEAEAKAKATTATPVTK